MEDGAVKKAVFDVLQKIGHRVRGFSGYSSNVISPMLVSSFTKGLLLSARAVLPVVMINVSIINPTNASLPIIFMPLLDKIFSLSWPRFLRAAQCYHTGFQKPAGPPLPPIKYVNTALHPDSRGGGLIICAGEEN